MKIVSVHKDLEKNKYITFSKDILLDSSLDSDSKIYLLEIISMPEGYEGYFSPTINLSPKRLKKVLNQLVSSGYLKESDGRYELTEKFLKI